MSRTCALINFTVQCIDIENVDATTVVITKEFSFYKMYTHKLIDDVDGHDDGLARAQLP
jgi:hypothetical protein